MHNNKTINCCFFIKIIFKSSKIGIFFLNIKIEFYLLCDSYILTTKFTKKALRAQRIIELNFFMAEAHISFFIIDK